MNPHQPLIARLQAERRLRAQALPADLFGEPCWDMLLDLAAHRHTGRAPSVTSLCLASGVPQTTALRHIGLLEQAGLVERRGDPLDARRRFLTLSDGGAASLDRFLCRLAASHG